MIPPYEQGGLYKVFNIEQSEEYFKEEQFYQN